MPGIGPKSAQRLAFYVLRLSDKDAEALINAVKDVKSNIRICDTCYNYTEGTRCAVCSDDTRDRSVLCVVAEPKDVVAMERTHEYRGLYHVLGGVISPMDGITPEMLRVRELMDRVNRETFKEVILATNPTIEGDATSMYIAGLIKPLGIKVTRIAQGMPVGSDMDYADKATLIEAMQWRREM